MVEIMVLEAGNIYFIYRPKVEQTAVDSIDDVQRFYLVLEPHGRTWFRLMTVGKKFLPDPGDSGESMWCFVEQATDSSQNLEKGLRRETYTTKTQGDRLQPAARPVGEGVYKIVSYEGDTRLVYALELPHELGPAQQTFNIGARGNFIISIKNPEKSSPSGAGFHSDERKADFPASLQQKFSDRRFCPADPPDFLDYEGTEFMLISTDAEGADAIGATLNPQNESETTAEVINNLRMRKTRHPLGPLLNGTLE